MINNKNDPTAAVGDDYSDMWTDPPFSATNPIHRGLQEMEENLRCYICRDFMTAPVSVDPCQHTFCSLCVQNHAKECLKGSRRRKMDCPSCRVEITGLDINQRLTRNPTVENLVKSFQGIRSKLKAALVLMGGLGTSATSEKVTGSESTSDGDDPQKAAKAVLEEVTTLQQTMADEHIGRRQRTRKNYAETSIMDDDDDVEDVDENYNPTESSIEEKEVGRIWVPNNNKQRTYQKKLSKPTYSLLKLKQRKDLCRDEGLSDSGSADELKERHERFVTRFNAYCDSLEPKTKAEVAREVEEDERQRMREKIKQESRARGASAADAIARLKRNCKQMGESEHVGASIVAQSGIAWFDDEMNENFARLIAEGRKHLSKKPKKAATDESEDKNQSPSEVAAKPEDTKNSSDASAQSIRDGQAQVPSGTPSSGADTASSTTANQTGTNAKPSGTQMAYEPEAVAGISNKLSPFSANETVNTPIIPKLFQPGSSVPSTISHKQSQESCPGIASGDPLPSASDMASCSPRATNAVASNIRANVQPQPFASSTAEQPRPAASSTTSDAEMRARHEAARVYALAEQDTNKTKAKKNNGKKRSPSNLLEAGITKTRRVVAPMRAPAPAPTRRSGRSIVGQWHCQVCTFFNEKNTWSTATCEMCRSKRSEQGQGACNEYVREATVSL